jgi:cyclopropane-fatty-acyl-phospholipid synthase
MRTRERSEDLGSPVPVRPPSPEPGWPRPTAAVPATGTTVADFFVPLLGLILGDRLPVRFEFWDGSAIGPSDGAGSVLVESPDALRRLLWAPGELGLARAFVLGDIEFEGDLVGVLRALRDVVPREERLRIPLLGGLRAARRAGALGLPLKRPDEEAAPRGLRHSKQRDAQVIRHHYDISNDFYRLVLGSSMTYSCARFIEESASLEHAQAAKHDMVCRKLGLDRAPGMRLLDVGCGWGSMALHAASAYGANVVGVTLSDAQAELANRRVKEAGFEDVIEVRVQDYRDLAGEQFDAISSIGMFEHVGMAKMAAYFESLHKMLAPTGRMLNHAISSVGGSRLGRRSFIGRYVFPDGELIDVGEVVVAMERAGFEVRDVESLREHYAKTLRAWVRNLQMSWDEAVQLVGSHRARIWLLYMAASVNGFEDGGISIHQVLGIRPGSGGESQVALTRRSWV